MFSLCSCGFPVGASVFPIIKTCIGLSPVSTFDRGTGSESGVGPPGRCGCPLLLRNGLNAENTFHCKLYM